MATTYSELLYCNVMMLCLKREENCFVSVVKFLTNSSALILSCKSNSTYWIETPQCHSRYHSHLTIKSNVKLAGNYAERRRLRENFGSRNGCSNNGQGEGMEHLQISGIAIPPCYHYLAFRRKAADRRCRRRKDWEEYTGEADFSNIVQWLLVTIRYHRG